MAGFVTGAAAPGGYYEFHIDTPDVLGKIAKAAGGKRVVSFQLDGDELVAALWGFSHYKNRHKLSCVTCNGEAELWANDGTGMCTRCVAVAMIEAHKDIRDAARKAILDEPETPVQEQLQYQEEQCPNCLKSGGVFDLPWNGMRSDGKTHGCHNCGQTWFYDEAANEVG